MGKGIQPHTKFKVSRHTRTLQVPRAAFKTKVGRDVEPTRSVGSTHDRKNVATHERKPLVKRTSDMSLLRYNPRPGMGFRITCQRSGGRISPPPAANPAPMKARITKLLWKVVWL